MWQSKKCFGEDSRIRKCSLTNLIYWVLFKLERIWVSECFEWAFLVFEDTASFICAAFGKMLAEFRKSISVIDGLTIEVKLKHWIVGFNPKKCFEEVNLLIFNFTLSTLTSE